MSITKPEDILPLSPMQEGMLFQALLADGAGLDFEQLVYRLTGELDVGALEDAWQFVVQRHAALRARFVWRGMDRPVQIVERAVTVPFAVVDWTGVVDEDTDLTEWLRRDRKAGVALDQAPLLRVMVMRRAPREHLMVVSFHHILLDGWSVRLVLRDLRTRYDEGPTAPELRRPAPRYRDYLAWLKTQDLDVARDFWNGELASFASPTQICGERRTAESGYGTVQITLDHEETTRLREFARARRVTVNTMVQGAWALLLARYGTTDDVVFGATMSTRPPAVHDVESMVGLMINTLPVRVRVPPLREVGDWLRQLQHSQLDMRQFDFTPLVTAQACSSVPQGSPLFDSIVVFENYPRGDDRDDEDGLQFEPIRGEERNGYPLSLVATVSQRLEIEVTYDRSRWTDDRIDRLAEHLGTIIRSMMTSPAQRLIDVAMLTDAERTRIVEVWNNTTADYPSGRCVHALFEDRVACDPDALAVTDVDGTRLSYRELNEQANQIAHLLQQMGAAPETTIGLCATPSAHALVGLLAILKSGAAYLPLDPEQPPSRLAFMLEDAQVGIVVAGPEQVPVVPPRFCENGGLVELGPDNPDPRSMPADNPVSVVSAANLAYTMYTSGSTGTPKGVLVHHQGLVNYLWWAIDGYGMQGTSGAPWFGSLAYDLSMPNYLVPLIAGKDVVVLPIEPTLVSLAEALDDGRDFSLVKVTPGHLDVLRQTMAGREVTGARTYVVGADEVKPETVTGWRAIAPSARIINEYGPTETVVGCSVYTADESFDPSAPVPIGRPIANIRMYVLDPAMQPVPTGVTGELFIAGAGVARGYLNKPAITAERFLPDPFGTGRLYRTGDLARYRSDGMIEFLGRIDHQVKIRGYRVELGEVDARLLEHPLVDEAVVTAHEFGPDDRRLVAYLVARNRPPTVDAMRSWVGDALPEFMIPSLFVFLPTLPLSDNGKVDRRALPAPDPNVRAIGNAFVAPRTQAEELVAGVWRDVLGTESVGVSDDFFDMGGHSLLATQVVSRLSGIGRGDVPLRVVFERPTVEGQAAWLEAKPSTTTAMPISPVDRSAPLPLSFAQQRLWFLDQLNPGRAEYAVPMAWRIRGELDVSALRQAIQATVDRHEILRTRFPSTDAEPIQVVLDRAEVDLPISDVAADASARHLDELAHRPFDLAAGPAWRMALLRESEDTHVLALVLHHILVDGWSMRTLVNEVAQAYRAIVRSETVRLPPLAVQYGDYAAWQRGWLQTEVLPAQLRYWRHKLDGLTALDLPTDRPRAVVQEAEEGSLDLTVPTDVAAGLRALGRKHKVTVYMILLATVQTLLGRYTGQDDVPVGTPIANRNRPETEPLIGFFVNTLVMRTDLGGNPTFVELLRRVRETTLDAYDNQDLPFEQLVEHTNPLRDITRSPLFTVLLQVNNEPATRWQLPGLQIEDVPIGIGEAKFDLSLTFVDDENGLCGTVRYRSSLFDVERVQRMTDHLIVLLRAAIANPRAKVSTLTMLTASERAEIADMSRPSPTVGLDEHPNAAATVHELARCSPADAALIAQDGRVTTYGELSQWVGRLASRLLAAGAGPDRIVAIAGETTPDLVASMLACMHVGAAFALVDPTLPDDARSALLRRCRAEIAVVNGPSASSPVRVPGGPNGDARPVEVTAGPWPEVTAPPVTRSDDVSVACLLPSPDAQGHTDLITFTHRDMTRRVHDRLAADPVAHDDVFGIAGSPTTLQVLTDLLGGVISGCPTVLLQGASTAPTDELVDTLAAHRISRIGLGSGVLRRILAAGGCDHRLEALSTIHNLGDVVDERTARTFQSVLPGRTLRNAYVAQCLGVEVADVSWDSASGLPLAHLRPGITAAVLDRRLDTAPIGVSGELYLGGEPVEVGFADAPSRTARRWIPSDLADGGGRRLFRTGQRGRWARPGVLALEGAFADEFSIRGLAVGPAGIEAALREVPGVEDAAVMGEVDTDGEIRLVAYLAEGAQGSGVRDHTGKLRAQLESHLPAFLIPSTFRPCTQLPLDPNGVVVREAVSSINPGSHDTRADSAIAELRRLVTESWAAVLGRDEIDPHANFFDIGGHSMLAAQAVARLRKRGFPALPLTSLFTRPTVAELADHLRELSAQSSHTAADEPTTGELSGLVPLNDGPVGSTMFCVHEGTGAITGYYELARSVEPELRLVGVAFDDAMLDNGTDDPVGAMANNYVAAMRDMQPHGPYLLLGWSLGGLVAYEMASRLAGAGETVEWVGVVDAVPDGPSKATGETLDRVLDELLLRSERILEGEWDSNARAILGGLLSEVDLRAEQVDLGKDGLRALVRRTKYFALARRNYVPSSADVPLVVMRAADGNWEMPWFEAWRRYAPNAEIREVAGDHLTVMERPQLEQVVSAIRDRIRPGADALADANRQQRIDQSP